MCDIRLPFFKQTITQRFNENTIGVMRIAPLPKLYIYNSIYSNIYYSVVQYKYTTMKEYIRLRVSAEDKRFIQQEAKKNKKAKKTNRRRRRRRKISERRGRRERNNKET